MPSQHSNGEGTIYRRKDGRWEGAIYRTTTTGMRKRTRVYGRTRAEVRGKLDIERARADQGLLIPDRNWRLSLYLDYWMERIVRTTKAPATHALYETVVRLYLKPSLGNRNLNSLSVATVQTFLNQRLELGDSPHMVYKIRTVLSAALTSAMREEIIVRNVARLVILPPCGRKEQRSWSADEARRFLQEAKHHPLYPAFLLLLTYGLRRGEVLGLRWSDILFESGTMLVRQQVQRVGRELIIGPLKTPASRRSLPLLDAVSEMLTVHHAKQSAMVAAPSSLDLVFTTATGQPIEPSNFVRSFQRLCGAAGLPRIHVHDLRRTVASLMNKLGVPPRDAQVILGHSRLAITLELYTNIDEESRTKAIDQMQALLAEDR